MPLSKLISLIRIIQKERETSKTIQKNIYKEWENLQSSENRILENQNVYILFYIVGFHFLSL